MGSALLEGQNKRALIALAAVLVVGGAVVAWRWMSAGGDGDVPPAVLQHEAAMQAAAERQGLNQPQVVEEEELEEDLGPPTRAPRQSPGSTEGD